MPLSRTCTSQAACCVLLPARFTSVSRRRTPINLSTPRPPHLFLLCQLAIAVDSLGPSRKSSRHAMQSTAIKRSFLRSLCGGEVNCRKVEGVCCCGLDRQVNQVGHLPCERRRGRHRCHWLLLNFLLCWHRLDCNWWCRRRRGRSAQRRLAMKALLAHGARKDGFLLLVVLLLRLLLCCRHWSNAWLVIRVRASGPCRWTDDDLGNFELMWQRRTAHITKEEVRDRPPHAFDLL
mmetsp:Transcript_9057/g.22857  ORF Transcript_9057/g.22857 Transcript_9057/m.22857 type:complete len:234 (+) Transcript_9057:252-953(+)